ncbi:tetratricopeptide repeat protein [Planctomonas sp. JC2975]|uniref:tetratricopeptide repeat protein n=1 Tax=Planctomonas sp. JC2975 TaxID=2729626 RepID=UPI001472C344|nr:tetratricopeptide repeat protein [Planctomonas sp. JC2975]
MAVLLAVYIVLVVRYGVILLTSGSGVGIAIAIALFVLSVIAVWALLRELWFGVQTQRLVRILESEGGLPVDDLPHRASGRPLRDAADEEFPSYKAEVEAAPESWRAWFRLALAYDASGDRRRARSATREAVKLHKSHP